MPNINWEKLKAEYVTGTASYRDLCAKYGVALETLKIHAKRDEWVLCRKEHRHRVATKITQRNEEKSIDYSSVLYDLAYKVAGQLDDLVKENTISDLAAIGLKPRDITGAIRDLKDALDIKSRRDLEEQDARIAHLRKQCEDEKTDSTVKVVISGDAAEFSK